MIARRFDIAEEIVKVHVKAILRNLGERKRTPGRVAVGRSSPDERPRVARAPGALPGDSLSGPRQSGLIEFGLGMTRPEKVDT
jgi:hypothetical protein